MDEWMLTYGVRTSFILHCDEVDGDGDENQSSRSE